MSLDTTAHACRTGAGDTDNRRADAPTPGRGPGVRGRCVVGQYHRPDPRRRQRGRVLSAGGGHVPAASRQAAHVRRVTSVVSRATPGAPSQLGARPAVRRAPLRLIVGHAMTRTLRSLLVLTAVTDPVRRG